MFSAQRIGKLTMSLQIGHDVEYCGQEVRDHGLFELQPKAPVDVISWRSFDIVYRYDQERVCGRCLAVEFTSKPYPYERTLHLCAFGAVINGDNECIECQTRMIVPISVLGEFYLCSFAQPAKYALIFQY